MASQVDLSQLAVVRTTGSQAQLVRKRHLLTRLGLPLAVLAGFAVVAVWSARDGLLPASPVTVVPVVLAHAEVHQAGTPLFQAAGWVEPSPTPVMATALVEGVVHDLLVIEGQEVQAGEPVAKLIDADARLALAEAESEHALAKAELNVAEATLKAANRSFQHPVHLQAALAEAEAELAKRMTEIRNVPFAIQGAEARLELATQNLQGKRNAGTSIPGRSLQSAQKEYDEARAALDELKQRGLSLQFEVDAWKRTCEARRRQLELKNDEQRQVEEAKAKLKAADARVDRAHLAIQSARLRLERMTIRSPIAGRVLALNAQPGRRLTGLAPASERDASTVVSLYDPKRLQVRADVRLEDVPHVAMGQPVQISTVASKEALSGEVVAVTSQADIQKNTLQVKVVIHDPPPVIKPEMLVQVVFLAPQTPGDKSEEHKDPLRMLVPRELVNTTGSGSEVWIADVQAKVARRRTVHLGQAGTEELIEVTSGLSAMDKLVATGRESLQDGQRIRVVGMDSNLGRESATVAQQVPVPTAANQTR